MNKVLGILKPILWGGIIFVALWTTLSVVLPGWQQLLQRRPEVPLRTQVAADEGWRVAMFWEELKGNKVLCNLCFRRCIIPMGSHGACRVRENFAGRLYSLVHSHPSAKRIDPIEKELQLHHRPGTFTLCVGTVGCNFTCKQCHNWTLSQASPTDLQIFHLPPAQLVEMAMEYGVTVISFTFNEPTVLFEYVFETAVMAKEVGVGLIWHTNAAIAEEPLRKLLPYTTAITVDLKGFCEKVYRDIFGGNLPYVLRSLKIIREEGVHLEIVNLIIPTINDCMNEIRAMSEWIAEHLGPDVPLHFMRFHPAFRLTHLPRTPVRTLEDARLISREVGINFVTIGNVPGHRYNSTFCSTCGEKLIHRVGFSVIANNVEEGRCRFCGGEIPGVWECK